MFDLLRFNLHGIFSVLSGLLCLGLGVMVLMKDRRSGVNRAFFLFTLSTAIWIVNYGFMSLTRTAADAALFDKLAYAYGIPFISIHSYLFSIRLRGKNDNKPILFIGYAWATCMALWFFIRYDKLSVIREFSWGRYSCWLPNTESTLQGIFLAIPFLIYSMLGVAHLHMAARESVSPIKKRQFKNCFFAFLIVYTAFVDFLTASGMNVYPFGYISLTGLTVIVAYTIIRHQLLDIRIVLKKLSLILLIYLGLFLLLLPTAAPLLRHLLNKPNSNPVATTFGVGIAIGLIFSLGPLIYAYLVRHSFWLKSNLTAGLTHELKSPLGIISGAVDVVLDDLDAPDINRQRLREYGQVIRKNALRMDAFVKDLLHLAKIQEDSISLIKEPVDLSLLAVEAADALRPLADQKNIKIVLHIADDVKLSADSDKIKQVFSSLLSNAIKYSDAGVITLNLSKTSKEALFSIEDEGHGIETKHLDRIFERFYQVNPGSKGSGIGLTIAKAWVEAHGGKIWAESKGLGKGTTVRFMLPIT